jgi:hypothetical protein
VLSDERLAAVPGTRHETPLRSVQPDDYQQRRNDAKRKGIRTRELDGYGLAKRPDRNVASLAGRGLSHGRRPNVNWAGPRTPMANLPSARLDRHTDGSTDEEPAELFTVTYAP